MSGTAPQSFWKVTVEPALRLSIGVLLCGIAVLVLLEIAEHLGFPNLAAFVAGATGAAPLVVGLAVFLVGLGFAGFLWWLARGYFGMIRDGHISGDNAKDLPLALPEGTVRAVLALIVGVVGMPLLLFSNILGLHDAIAGYINGIVTGVFGFYFGTRTAGIPTQAMNQIVQAQGKVDAAQLAAAASQQTAATTTRAGKFNEAVDVVSRNLGLASTVLDVVGPVAPELLPAGLSDVVSKAQSVVSAIQGVTGQNATEGNLSAITGVIDSLLGGSGSSSSIGSLLTKAAPMLSGLAIPGLGAIGGLGLLVTIGMKLGSAEFQRWRTRVLAAPLASGLIPSGTLTPDEVQSVMEDSPKFDDAFSYVSNTPGLYATLAAMVLADDALTQLWSHFGPGESPAVFTDQSVLEAGLAEFQQKLLASRSANDVSDDLAKQAAATLAQAANPALHAADPSQITGDVANQLIDAASQASAASDPSKKDAQAAFDALITLVGNARQKNIDLTEALTEVKS